jgi:hypothetical protein
MTERLLDTVLGQHLPVAEIQRSHLGELGAMVCGGLLGLSGLIRIDDWQDPFRWLALLLLVGCAIRVAVLARR